MVERKKGWIRMVEVFISITLIMGFLIIMISDESPESEFNERVYSFQSNVLKEIENNDLLRGKIIDVSSLPVLWEEENFPSDIKEKINSEKPVYVNCTAKICGIGSDCLFQEDADKDIYSHSVGIFADNLEYSPRQLRLFCWTNNL